MTPLLADAIDAWRAGRPVLVTVADRQRVRGDLAVAAEHASPTALNQLLLHARGVLCLVVDETMYERLELGTRREPHIEPPPNPHAPRAATTIEASVGVTTGISSADRARTIAAAIDPRSAAGDVREPGHVPVLVAAAGGVLQRPRPAETAVELSRLAGLIPAGVVSEVLGDDGELAGERELAQLARRLGAPLLPIAAVAAHLAASAA